MWQIDIFFRYENQFSIMGIWTNKKNNKFLGNNYSMIFFVVFWFFKNYSITDSGWNSPPPPQKKCVINWWWWDKNKNVFKCRNKRMKISSSHPPTHTLIFLITLKLMMIVFKLQSIYSGKYEIPKQQRRKKKYYKGLVAIQW